MPTTLRIALLAGLLALLSNLAVIGFIHLRTHDEAASTVRRQVAEQTKVLTQRGSRDLPHHTVEDSLTEAAGESR